MPTVHSMRGFLMLGFAKVRFCKPDGAVDVDVVTFTHGTFTNPWSGPALRAAQEQVYVGFAGAHPESPILRAEIYHNFHGSWKEFNQSGFVS